MLQRETLLDFIASEIKELSARAIVFVGIDGVDGAGKTTFADELAALFEGHSVIRASVDGFHNSKNVRYAKGKRSPLGFYEDSYNYSVLRQLLLDPLKTMPPQRYRCSYFDHRVDAAVEPDWQDPPDMGILLFDGIFLHRRELVGYWDYSIFLDVSRHESVRRCIDREGAVGVSDDPGDPIHHRYVEGQKIYLDSCKPTEKCTRLINNEVLEAPMVVA